MAWTYEQKFNGLTLGDLNGQDSWTANTAWDVQDSVKYEGAQALQISLGSGQTADRSITAITDGSVYVAMRKTATTGQLYFILRQSATSRMFLKMSGGEFRGFDGVVYQLVGTYSINTWHVVNVEFDNVGQPNLWRARVHGGSSWGAFSSWIGVNGGSYASISAIRLDTDNSGGTATAYVDTITPTDPTAAPAGNPQARRWGGVPFVGGMGVNSAGYGSGKMWGRRQSGLVVPERFREAA